MKTIFIPALTALTLLAGCGLDPSSLLGQKSENDEPIIEKWSVCRDKALTFQNRAGSSFCEAPVNLNQIVYSASTSSDKLILKFNKIGGADFPILSRLNFYALKYDGYLGRYQSYTVKGDCKDVSQANGSTRDYECKPLASNTSDRFLLDSMDLENPSCGATASYKSTYPHPSCDDGDAYSSYGSVYIGHTNLSGVYPSR